MTTDGYFLRSVEASFSESVKQDKTSWKRPKYQVLNDSSYLIKF
ncbi:hypothetical protein [Emticicia sp.]